MKGLILLTISLLLAGVARSEGDSAPPLMASPVSLSQPDGISPLPDRPESCDLSPCSAECAPHVSCRDYDTARDRCAGTDKVLVDWTCHQPCSCMNGQVVCSVSFQCISLDQYQHERENTVGSFAPLDKPEIEISEPSPSSWPTESSKEPSPEELEAAPSF